MRLKQFNETIAARMVLAISTMGAVYLFLGWSLLPVFVPKWQAFIFYVSGGILQLVLLPVIMVGQSVLSRAQEARAAQDHAVIMESHEELREELQEIKEIHRLLVEKLGGEIAQSQ